jgi:hypothetical protein
MIMRKKSNNFLRSMWILHFRLMWGKQANFIKIVKKRITYGK